MVPSWYTIYTLQIIYQTYKVLLQYTTFMVFTHDQIYHTMAVFVDLVETE